MKKIKALLLAFLLIFLAVTTVQAQASESIWLEADTTAYKTEEIVIVRMHGASSSPIQGFTFQIRYDPSCLKPLNASSPISGMNGLQLPQQAGMVDASFASTTPQTALGVLAEATFQTLGGCQTELYLESAALAVRSEEGFAVPLEGITLGERNVSLNIDNSVGSAQEPALLGAPLSLEPTEGNSQSPDWAAAVAVSLLFLVVMAIVVVILVVYKRSYSA